MDEVKNRQTQPVKLHYKHHHKLSNLKAQLCYKAFHSTESYAILWLDDEDGNVAIVTIVQVLLYSSITTD